MDSQNLQKINVFLTSLGLNSQQIEVYIFLLKNGGSSVLQISKGLKTGRTKLYPLLEELRAKQLVFIHEKHYGSYYEVAPTSSLEFLINEQESRVQTLKSALPAARHILDNLKTNIQITSKIIEYKGIEGLKQINFNLTKAKKEFRVFEVSNLDNHEGIPKYYAEKLREIWVSKKITSYDLTNKRDTSVKTKVKDFKKFSKTRYISPNIFKIKFETYIYNNCVALLNYSKSDIFGVEVYNQDLAEQQRQIFDLLWELGEVP